MNENRLNYQEAIFANLGLDRNSALNLCNKVCMKLFNQPYSEDNGMWSEHLVFFAALALKSKRIHKILEIGTFNGETTLFLAELFPKAKILTIDLDNLTLQTSNPYEYAFSNDKFFEYRQNLLKKNKNIKFLQQNSLNLVKLKETFDLIWIDGNHNFPTVIIDLINCLKLLSNSGVALCDDVYKRKFFPDKYADISCYEALKELEDNKVIALKLIQKRIKKRRLSNDKYIGYITLN